jgi:TRAP-type mannitol/chloroaromatic compound transport system permease small subunit
VLLNSADETGSDHKGIEVIMSQAGYSRATAVTALKENDAGLVNSIMRLTKNSTTNSILDPSSCLYLFVHVYIFNTEYNVVCYTEHVKNCVQLEPTDFVGGMDHSTITIIGTIVIERFSIVAIIGAQLVQGIEPLFSCRMARQRQ